MDLFGLVEWRGKGEDCRAAERCIGGVRFLAVGILRGTGPRAAWSLRRAARSLTKRGVRQAVFPEDFSLCARFARRGILPVDERALRESRAAAILRCAMEARGLLPERATVALCAGQATGAYCRAAAQAAKEIRYLRLCTASGGEALSHALRRTLGAAVTVEQGTGEVDLALLFDRAGERLAPCGPTLPLFDSRVRVDYVLPPEIDAGGADRAQLASALFAALALRAEEIGVAAVRLEKSKT